jgi:hypothetical protein
MLPENLQMLVRLAPWSKNVEICLGYDVGSEFAYGQAVVFEQKDRGFCPEPTMILPPKAAQELMDDLWKCGYRPSEGSGSAGSLLATENHLQDMRKIAFDLLKTTAP